MEPLHTILARSFALIPTTAVGAVQGTAEQQLSVYAHILFGPTADRVLGLVLGLLTPSEWERNADDDTLRKAVTARVLLSQIATALRIFGKAHESCVAWAACGHCFVELGARGETLRLQARAARPQNADNREGGRIEREIYRFWADAAFDIGGASAALRVHELGVIRGAWPNVLQRPVGQYARALTAKPFWDAAEVPGARALEASYAVIRKELEGLLKTKASTRQAFVEYKSDSLKAGEWTDFQLFAGCRRDVANCTKCPKSAAVIAAQPLFNELLCGAHFFSRLTPGTHIGAHCGPSNLRLRCHLALKVPSGCRIRVGDEVRTWTEGECCIFDDSFEHEVWHEGSSDRVVLICDLWHPELDVEREIRASLPPAEQEVFDAARRGEHLPILERHYTAGPSLKR